jgi:hypothetical protein
MDLHLYKELSGMFGFISTQHLREKKMSSKIQFCKLLHLILLDFFSIFPLQKCCNLCFFIYNNASVDRSWL